MGQNDWTIEAMMNLNEVGWSRMNFMMIFMMNFMMLLPQKKRRGTMPFGAMMRPWHDWWNAGVQTAEEPGVLFPRRLPNVAHGQEMPGAAREAQGSTVQPAFSDRKDTYKDTNQKNTGDFDDYDDGTKWHRCYLYEDHINSSLGYRTYWEWSFQWARSSGTMGVWDTADTNSAGFSCATRLKQSLGQKPEFAMQISHWIDLESSWLWISACRWRVHEFTVWSVSSVWINGFPRVKKYSGDLLARHHHWQHTQSSHFCRELPRENLWIL